MPVKGYDSVNLPSGLYNKVKALVKSRSDLGYRSITEFVAEAARARVLFLRKSILRSEGLLIKRNRYDIIADMLEAARFIPCKKPHLMYKCNLSFTQLSKYLEVCLSRGLIHHNGNSTFSLTKRGREFLTSFGSARQILDGDRNG